MRRMPLALRQPEQVAGEEVAMDEAGRPAGDRRQHRLERARRSPGARRPGRRRRTWRATTSRTAWPARWPPWSRRPRREGPAGRRRAAWRPARRPRRRVTQVGTGVPPSSPDSHQLVAQILLQQQTLPSSSAAKISGTDTPMPARCPAMRTNGRTSSGGGASISTAGRGPAAQPQVAPEAGILRQRLGRAAP